MLSREWSGWRITGRVNFDYMSRPEIVLIPLNAGVNGVLPNVEHSRQDIPLEFEERGTGGCIF